MQAKNNKDWKRRIYGAVVLRSWWVWVFLLGSYFLFSYAIKKKTETYLTLQNRLVELKNQKEIALQEREDLLLQINSQSDPAWIELVLMKGLGVVPEGQKKIYFKKQE